MTTRKGILLAGGSGTRLQPLTSIVCKQLLPIYYKPMIYYPLSTLMLSGIREILLITTPKDVDQFKQLLGDGSSLGIHIQYRVQPRPEGIAQALLIAEEFLNDSPCSLILGDNLFYGDFQVFRRSTATTKGATIFGYHVKDPERFGVVEFDKNHQVISLEEKPLNPKSSYALPGLYHYDHTAVERTKSLKPSKRGELEITDLNLSYLKDQQLKVEILGRGIAWLDTGTPQSLLEAASFVSTIEHQQNQRIACLEEVAWRQGFIDTNALQQLSTKERNPRNKAYLNQLLREHA